MFDAIVLDDGTTYEPTDDDIESAIYEVMKNLSKKELIDLILDYIAISDLKEEYYDEMYEILCYTAQETADELKLVEEEEKRRHS